jgi:hypothetical protein
MISGSERVFNSYIYKFSSLTFFTMLLLLCGGQAVIAQANYTVSGTVKDKLTGEILIGATVKTLQPAPVAVTTNSYGFYSFTISGGPKTFIVSYIGYQADTIKINLTRNTHLNFQMNVGSSLKEVVVSDHTERGSNLSGSQIGVNKLNVSELNNIPVLLGEKDVVKAIELLPGVKTTGDANTGFYVRGGGADQNLILLDGATVYNASHLFGFFSTFNSDAIKSATLYKGGMPADYGGRLSSVLDVSMNDGNNKQYTVEGGIGLIASRIKVEGPIVKDKSSFMISARRTYADIFLKLSPDSSLRGSSLYFYDLNLKANYRLNERNTVYLSGYLGQDVIGLKNNFSTNWGNVTGTLRLNHLVNDKLFSNTSLIYSKYNYTVINYGANTYFQAVSKIADVSLKQDYEYFYQNKHTVHFGAAAVYHTIVPGDISTTATSSYNSRQIENRYSTDLSAYVSDNWQAATKLYVVYGVRLNNYLLFGPGTFSSYDALGNAVMPATYSTAQLVKSYFNVEPRLSMVYTLNNNSSLKASYNRNTQNLHLLSNSTASLPSDVYVMSSNNIKPGISDQVSGGYFKNLDNNRYEFSGEVYYKWLQNEVDYKDGAQLVANQNIESELLYGTGRAYGLELFLKKRYGKLNGWVGYTLSRTERKFDQINNGAYFPARQDRTHDVSLVTIYNYSHRWTFSGVFIYGTGNAVTYPASKYQVGGLTTFYYANRNANRLPANSRLDLGATLDGKQHKKYHSSFTFSIYNALNRKNPYSVVFKDSNDKPPKTEAVETSLFGIIPSVSWNFKFN